MIKPLLSYARDGLAPRFWRITLNVGFALSILIGVGCFLQWEKLPVAQLKASDIGGMVLTYAAIAFGFCITGMALVLTLPSDRFLRTLQQHRINGGAQSSYLDLLFVFSWTAVCHWLLVVSAITIVLIRGAAPTIMSQLDGSGWRYFVSFFFALCAYGLIQFLMTVITLSQLGGLYSKALTKDSSLQ